MSDYDSVPWETDPVRKAILNEPGKTIHDLREENTRLREELDRHHHDDCIQELQDAVMEAETRANDRGAKLARLREALARIGSDDVLDKTEAWTIARNALKGDA